MAQDLYWDHSAEDFENERSTGSIQTRRSELFLESDDKVMIPRRQLYALMHDLRRLHDALTPYLRMPLEETTSSQFIPNTRVQRFRWWLVRMTRYIFVITFIIQIFNTALLSIIDIIPKERQHVPQIIAFILMLITLLVNVFILVVASVHMVKHLYNQSPSFLFLAQTYLSTALLFTGIYLSIFLLDKKAWHHMNMRPDNLLVVELFCRFLFFSISCGTLSGDSETVPNIWYTWLLVSFQVVFSYLFFGAVISQAVFNKTETGHIALLHARQAFSSSNARSNVLQSLAEYQSKMPTTHRLAF